MDRFKEALGKLYDKLLGWVDEFVLLLPNLIIAAVVMGISIFLSRYINKLAYKLSLKVTSNRTVSNVISSVTTSVFVLLMLFVVLGILHLDKALTSLLAGAGVVGLAVGLALQEPLVNLFSGVMMSVRELFNIGDLVETNGHFGTIQRIDLRSTLLQTPTGELITIPNKQVLQEPLKNYTASGNRKVVVDCGVSYGDDLEKVERVVIDTLSDMEECDGREIDFFYNSFGDSSINFTVRFQLNDCEQSNYLAMRSKAIMAMKDAFDEHDITIPFPIRTLDFGIKGGQGLAQSLVKVNGNLVPSNN